MDRISVIVPVHNGTAYLEECIDSILAQDCEALEVLIINDGSTDDTAAVCERLCGQHSCLRVITMPDLGVSAARNRGLEQAKGAYIMFVDADDRLRPGCIDCFAGRAVIWRDAALPPGERQESGNGFGRREKCQRS